MQALIASAQRWSTAAERCETCVPCLTDTATVFRDGGLSRKGSNVQKQLAQEPNTMFSGVDLADIPTALIRDTATAGRNGPVDTFIASQGRSGPLIVKQA